MKKGSAGKSVGGPSQAQIPTSSSSNNNKQSSKHEEADYDTDSGKFSLKVQTKGSFSRIAML